MVNVGERLGLLRKADWESERVDEGTKVTRTSIFTGERNTLTLPITREELGFYIRGEGLVQELFPQLDPDQREFLISGATPEEWESMFGD